MGSKIILITHEFAPYRGGVATYCEEVARASVALGEEIEVWTQGNSRGDELFPFPVRRLPGAGNLRPLSLFLLMVSLVWRTSTLKQARVYLPSRGSQWVYLNLYRLFGWNPGKEIIVTFHGTEILRYARNSWLRNCSNRFFRQSAHLLTTASAYSVKLLHEKGFGEWTATLQVAPCALKGDFQRIESGGEVQRNLQEFRILTLARVHPRKGQREVAKALGGLSSDLRSRVIYQIAGKGEEDYLQQVVSQCRESGIRYEVLGQVSESQIAATYQNCDLYVMTSHSLAESVEGFGMTYLEAGFFKRPVVGYRTGGVEEAVLDGRSGLLVDEGDLEGLTEAIERILRDPILARDMGEEGYKHALSFSWEKTARILFGSGKEYNVN